MQTHFRDVDKVFESFPNMEFWKLIIDQALWPQNDPLFFDKDKSKGYLENTTKALYYCLATINTPLTMEYIIGIHTLAFHEQSAGIIGFTSNAASGLGAGLFTLNGMNALLEKIRHGVPLTLTDEMGSPLQFDSSLPNNVLAPQILSLIETIDRAKLTRKTDIEEVKQYTRLCLERYHTEIATAGESENRKLKAIVTFIQDMHQYHPFPDGNGRTFIFLILNKLLIQNGLSPTSIKLPGSFTGWSVEELIIEVKSGQEVFKALCSVDNKHEAFLDYLKKLIVSLTEKDMMAMALIDCATLYKSIEGKSFVHANLPKLYETVFIDLTEKSSIDNLFSLAPPPKSILFTILSVCIRKNPSNEYMANKIIELWPNEKVDVLKSADFVYDIVTRYEKEQLSRYLSNPKLQFSSWEIDKVLRSSESVTPDEPFSPSMIFRTLLVNEKGDYLKLMLELLKNEHLTSLLATTMEGINGLQLLLLFRKDIYEDCCSRIDNAVKFELLKQKITTLRSPELELSKKINFPAIIERKLQLDTTSMKREVPLNTLSTFAANKTAKPMSHNADQEIVKSKNHIK